MRKFILLCVLFALAISVNAISISTLDEQFSQNNQTVLRFKIENNSHDTLKEIELRYHVKQDTSKIAEPDLYYLPEGMANWSYEDSLNATLVIYFPNTILYPGDTLGGNSGFSIGLHNKNWSAWSKNDDPSQPKSNTFSVANNIEVLSSGKPLMLTAAKNAGCPVVQFVEVQKDSIALQILQKLNSDSSFITIKNKNDNSIQVNLNDAKTDSLGQKIWRGLLPTQDSVEHRGELFAECNGNLLAYFALGWKPENASDAVEKNLWESTDSFVKAEVGNIFSAKPVLLRDRAFVHGNLETANTIIKQSSTIKVAGSIIEHSPHENSTKQAYDNFFDNTFDWNIDFEISNSRVLNSGENLTSGLFSYNFRKIDFNFNSGSNLILNASGDFYAGALKFQKDSKLIPQTDGSVIFYVGNDFQWNGTVVADDMISAAQHLMIYYYGTSPVYIQTEFAGTIIAPNAEVIVGQVGKNFYGAIYAKSIVVHQDTKVTWVPFLRETANAVVANLYR